MKCVVEQWRVINVKMGMARGHGINEGRGMALMARPTSAAKQWQPIKTSSSMAMAWACAMPTNAVVKGMANKPLT